MEKILLLIILGFLCLSSFAQNEQDRIQLFNHKEKVGIHGYDPVLYFINQKPSQGQRDISTTYKGIQYHFISTKNKEIFLQDPAKYEPMYGGWCAYAMGKNGSRVKVDPETYKIVNGELYLFYNFFYTNTLEDWNENEPVLKKQADSNWKHIYSKN